MLCLSHLGVQGGGAAGGVRVTGGGKGVGGGVGLRVHLREGRRGVVQRLSSCSGSAHLTGRREETALASTAVSCSVITAKAQHSSCHYAFRYASL